MTEHHIVIEKDTPTVTAVMEEMKEVLKRVETLQQTFRTHFRKLQSNRMAFQLLKGTLEMAISACGGAVRSYKSNKENLGKLKGKTIGNKTYPGFGDDCRQLGKLVRVTMNPSWKDLEGLQGQAYVRRFKFIRVTNSSRGFQEQLAIMLRKQREFMEGLEAEAEEDARKIEQEAKAEEDDLDEWDRDVDAALDRLEASRTDLPPPPKKE